LKEYLGQKTVAVKHEKTPLSKALGKEAEIEALPEYAAEIQERAKKREPEQMPQKVAAAEVPVAEEETMEQEIEPEEMEMEMGM